MRCDAREPVRAPHRHEVYHAAAPYEQNVLAHQVGTNIGNARLSEQGQDAEVDLRAGCEQGAHRLDNFAGVPDSGGDEADPLGAITRQANSMVNKCPGTLTGLQPQEP
jgi:hypothetical protein